MQWVWVSLLIRSALIFIAAEMLRHFPPKLAPADRHRILLAAFGLLFVWPVFSALMPKICIPLWFGSHTPDTVTIQQTTFILGRGKPQPSTIDWPVVIWMTGVLLTLAPVVVAYLNVFRMARRAIPINNDALNELRDTLCKQLAIRKKPAVLTLAGPSCR